MNTQSQNPPATELEPDATAETAGSESEALLKDLAEQKDLHLRLAADFENFKRRSRLPPHISKEDELLWKQLATQATFNPRKTA